MSDDPMHLDWTLVMVHGADAWRGCVVLAALLGAALGAWHAARSRVARASRAIACAGLFAVGCYLALYAVGTYALRAAEAGRGPVAESRGDAERHRPRCDGGGREHATLAAATPGHREPALRALRATLRCRRERTREDLDALDRVDALLGVDCASHADDLDQGARYERSALLWSRCGPEHAREAFDRWVGLGRFDRASDLLAREGASGEPRASLRQAALTHLLARRYDRVAATLRREVARQEGVLEDFLPEARDAPVRTIHFYQVYPIETRVVRGAWLTPERCALATVEARIARRPLDPVVAARCRDPEIPAADWAGVAEYERMAELASVRLPPEPQTSLAACGEATSWIETHHPPPWQIERARAEAAETFEALRGGDGGALYRALIRWKAPVSRWTWPLPLTPRTLVAEAGARGRLPEAPLAAWLAVDDLWLGDRYAELPRVLVEREFLAALLGDGARFREAAAARRRHCDALRPLAREPLVRMLLGLGQQWPFSLAEALRVP